MPSRLASLLLPITAGGALLLAGCSRDLTGLDPAPFPAVSAVFLDNFAPGMGFQAFGGSKLDALTVDNTVRRNGTASLKVTVPAPGDPTGGYAGGAFVSNVPRDLSGFTALTFWARASQAATLNVAGIGNDNTGTSRYTAQVGGLALTTQWRKYVIPLPLPGKLTQEAGSFFFAEGAEGAAGYDIWFDDIQFETIAVGTPRPAIATSTIAGAVGSDVTLPGTVVGYTIGGSDVVVEASPRYFTAISSNAAVATPNGEGVVSVVGTGTAEITAQLGTIAAAGTITLNVGTGPQVAAPTPTRAAGSVISLYSNAYPNRTVDTWSAPWDQADVSDVQVAGNDTKRYDNLVFAGIEFVSAPVNATAMTHFHLDVYTAAAEPLKIKLVDFGANGTFGGGDDSEHELTISTSTTPGLVANDWSSLDIPLSAFTGLTGRSNLAQLILVGGSPTIFVDNIYFYSEAAPTAPVTAAPTPTYAAGDAIAFFSDAYTNRTVDTWSAPWDQADVADVQVAGNATKLYTNLVFAGIETITAPINATAMTHFRMDIWTPNPTADPAVFRIKLVDLGANGAFGGGDDVEHEVTLTATTTPGLATGQWVTLDVPLTAFTGLTTRAAIGQLIISGSLGTVYVDNVLLHR